MLRGAALNESDRVDEAVTALRSLQERTHRRSWPFDITHACLLAPADSAGNGRVERARALLAGLRAPNAHRQSRAYAALARGLVACACGDLAAARREYDDAKSRGATAAPLRVVERRLASL